MTILTEDTLDRMRAAVAATLPDSAVLSSRAFTSDSGGGGTVAWTPYGTVECRLSPVGPTRFGHEVNVGERVVSQESWLITFPEGTVVTPESRVTTKGKTFEVIAIHQPRSWELVARVEVSEAVA